ncbi:MAG: hypothetical protein ACO4AU_16345, partial [bacterium]
FGALVSGEVDVLMSSGMEKCWSVRHKGKVIAHRSSLSLKDCLLKVSEAGRKRVRAEKTKNVHAFVRGEWTDSSPEEPVTELYYNPYKTPSFQVKRTGEPVHESKHVVLTEDRKVFGVC